MGLVSPRIHTSPQAFSTVLTHCGSSLHPIQQRSETVLWFLSDWLGDHHPLSPVIKSGLCHPKKERNQVSVKLSIWKKLSINVAENTREVKCKYMLFHIFHFRLFKPKHATKEDHGREGNFDQLSPVIKIWIFTT